MRSVVWVAVMMGCGPSTVAPAAPPSAATPVAGPDVEWVDPALAFGREVVLAETTEGVPITARLGLHVRSVPNAWEYGTNGELSGRLGAEDDLDAFLASIRGTGGPLCSGDGEPTYVTATREAPREGDAIVFINPAAFSTSLFGIIAMSKHPTVVAVRAPGSSEVKVLPYRFCGSLASPPDAPASTLEVVVGPRSLSTSALAPATGTRRDTRVDQVAWSEPPARLQEEMRRVARDQPIAGVRISNLHVELSFQQLVDHLAAAALAGATTVTLELEPRPIVWSHLRIRQVTATGGVAKERARTALIGQIAKLSSCQEQVAFATPELVGTVQMTAPVTAMGAVGTPVFGPDVSPAFVQCVTEKLAGMLIPRIHAVGSFTAELEIERVEHQPMAGDVPSL